jgi:hypothetical protein
MAFMQFEQLGVARVRVGRAMQYIDHNVIALDFKNPDDHRFQQALCAKHGVHYSRPRRRDARAASRACPPCGCRAGSTSWLGRGTSFGSSTRRPRPGGRSVRERSARRAAAGRPATRARRRGRAARTAARRRRPRRDPSRRERSRVRMPARRSGRSSRSADWPREAGWCNRSGPAGARTSSCASPPAEACGAKRW